MPACLATREIALTQRVHLRIMRAMPTVQFTAQLSGFPAAHPGDASTAWFVPGVADPQRVPVAAALAVNRTRDGGTTGGLWSSDDGGDRCLRVVALPPPMCAVRFG